MLGALCLRPRRPAADGAAEPPSRLERLFFRKPAGQPAAPAGETPAGQSDPLALILAAAALAVLAGSGFLQGLGVSRWWRNEYRARETLRVIQAAEEQYLAAAGRYGALAALALGALEQPGFNAPGGGTRSGYAFHCAPAAAGRAFVARAAPLEPGITGRYWFYLDESGVLRAAEQPRVDAGSPPAE